MAKKLQAKTAARRPATAAAPRRPAATLVRPEAPSAASDGAAPSKSATAMTTAPSLKRPTTGVVGARAVTTKPAPKPVNPTPASASATRAARPQTRPQAVGTRRSHISAENFGYVIHDLRNIAIIAVLMFAVIIICHFVLPQSAIRCGQRRATAGENRVIPAGCRSCPELSGDAIFPCRMPHCSRSRLRNSLKARAA